MGNAASNSLPPVSFAYTKHEAEYVTEDHNGSAVWRNLPVLADYMDESKVASAEDTADAATTGGPLTPQAKLQAAVNQNCRYVGRPLATDGRSVEVPLLCVPGAWNVDTPHLQLTPANTKTRRHAKGVIKFTKISMRESSAPMVWQYAVAFDEDGKWVIPNRTIFVAYRDTLTKLQVELAMPTLLDGSEITLNSGLDRGQMRTREETENAMAGQLNALLHIVEGDQRRSGGGDVTIIHPTRMGCVEGEEVSDHE